MMVETLPARWYADDAILKRERQTIFARNWALFGPEHEVKEPGSWRSETAWRGGSGPCLISSARLRPSTNFMQKYAWPCSSPTP